MEFVCDNCGFKGTNIQVRLYKTIISDIQVYMCNNCHPVHINKLLENYYRKHDFFEVGYSLEYYKNNPDILNSQIQGTTTNYMRNFIRYHKDILRLNQAQHDLVKSCDKLNRVSVYNEKLRSLCENEELPNSYVAKPVHGQLDEWTKAVNNQLHNIEENAADIFASNELNNDVEDNGEMKAD